MFTSFQLYAFVFLFTTMNLEMIRSDRMSPQMKYTPSEEDVERCRKNLEECNDLKEYPTEHVEFLISNNPLFKEPFNADKPKEIVKRSSLDEVYPRSTLCKSVERIIFPKIGDTERGQKYIIQMEDAENDYRQAVIVDECEQDGHICDELQQYMNSTCVQRYEHKYLWAVDNLTGEPAFTSFKFPAGCVCMYLDNKE